MKKSIVAVLVALFGWVAAPQAAEPLVSEKALGGSFSANVGFVSEYFFRGISQSDDSPALQGGFDYSHDSGFYVGVWGSNVNFNDGNQAQVEIDYYGGIAGEVDKLSWDVGVIYYQYPGAAGSLDYDFIEFTGTLGYDFGMASASVGLYYSPDYFGGSGDAVYITGDVEVPLGKYFTLGLHAGYQDIEKNANFGVPDYWDYSISVSTNVAGFDLGVTYKDTDVSSGNCADGCDEAVWLSVSRSF